MLQEEKRIRLKDGSLATIKGNARSLDGELSCRTLPDVTEQRRLEKEILDLSLRQELEIVRDLHDVLGQTLIAVSLSARTLISTLGSAKPAAQDAAQLEALITEAITQMRALARGSSPIDFSSGNDTSVAVKIEDNGVGFLQGREAAGMGLQTMKYRAKLIGAGLEITAVEGGGTRVVCTVSREHAGQLQAGPASERPADPARRIS
jgi:signal transduction histidine kinase